MPLQGMTAEEVGRLADEIYARDIRPRVEPQHVGKFLIIDVLTGDYDIDEDEVALSRRMMAKHPDGAGFLIRIGYPAAHWFGGIRRTGEG